MATETSKDYFVFSVATKKGTSPGGFGALVNQLVSSRLKLRGFSAFVSGRRTKVFCIPEDPDAFRAFAKQRGLRVSWKSASVGEGNSWQALGMLNKWAISGEIPRAFSFSSQGESFVYREVHTG